MSLAFELTRIPGSDYLPRPEFTADRAFPTNDDDGIWDLLGMYDSGIGGITMFEDNIMDLAKKLSSRTSNVYPVLRELVRMHEHAHAFIHTASLFEGKSRTALVGKDWFKGLSKDVSESLAEYVVVCVLESGFLATRMAHAF